MYTGMAKATANPARQPHMVSRLLVLAWSSLFGTSGLQWQACGTAWQEALLSWPFWL
jgi:hypothetical protein